MKTIYQAPRLTTHTVAPAHIIATSLPYGSSQTITPDPSTGILPADAKEQGGLWGEEW